MTDIRDRMTERLLSDAGVRPGMRVLDIGCGRGDVSVMVARLVGDEGRVVGVDRDAVPLAVARQRVRDLGLSNVSFAEGDFDGASAEGDPFDAVVGRRVLMYQPDPVDAVKRLASRLRPGGLAVFQEHDATMVGCLHSLPLHARVREWIWQTVEREGADIHMGFHLASVFAGAGLECQQLRAEAIVQTPTSRHPVETIIKAILPRIIESGVATEGEVDVDTLGRRLQDELEQRQATYIGEMVFGGWARKPEGTS